MPPDRLHLGCRQVDHLAFFTAVVFSAVPVEDFLRCHRVRPPGRGVLSTTNSQSPIQFGDLLRRQLVAAHVFFRRTGSADEKPRRRRRS